MPCSAQTKRHCDRRLFELSNTTNIYKDGVCSLKPYQPRPLSGALFLYLTLVEQNNYVEIGLREKIVGTPVMPH